MKPKVCILRTDGTNCDEELFYAFSKFGGDPQYVHVNELRSKSRNLLNYKILAIPGGFTYGDDVVSGKILAVELISFFKKQLQDFIKAGGLVLGVCNGFQVLVRTGLLPFNNIGNMDATLIDNSSGRFECRWVKLKTHKSKCKFLNVNSEKIGEFAVNHGEGKFFTSKETLSTLRKNNQIIFSYVNSKGKNTLKFPGNPNGSKEAIAGICDTTGYIIGLMPHPEKFIDINQHPNWRREKFKEPHGAFIFKNLINFAKKNG